METGNSSRTLSKDGSRHVTDERFNTISHLLGFMFALPASVLLMIRGFQVAVWYGVGACLYALGLNALFLCSTLHHGIHGTPRFEERMRTLDYLAIFLLIGGTFSPFCLTVARGPLGWTVFGVIWFFCVVGMSLRATNPHLPKAITMTFYVGLGWLATLIAPAVWETRGPPAAIGLAIGGLLYTVGGVIYVREKPNPIPGVFGFHEIWHLFVLAGAAFHYAVLSVYWIP
jgi:hemolysin III